MSYYGEIRCKWCLGRIDAGLVDVVEIDGMEIAIVPLKGLEHDPDCRTIPIDQRVEGA